MILPDFSLSEESESPESDWEPPESDLELELGLEEGEGEAFPPEDREEQPVHSQRAHKKTESNVKARFICKHFFP
ncbi:hypothetical protein SDC9_114296 [bioreactor metagenome]|uniref:Uncharacterized protein n=1 Tax=bioreactor metagenome TaxID=1076179 RepID=A0A645C083_9ZZZZ